MTPPEEPDALEAEHFARFRRIRGWSTLLAVLVSVGAIVIAVMWLINDPDDWMFIAIMAVGVIVAAGACALIPTHTPPDRPIPDTPLEVGYVILSEVWRWDSRSHVSLVIEPLDRPGTLVHGDVSVSGLVDQLTGTLVGFRRHSTQPHLVWVDRQAPLDRLAVAATAADPDAALRILRGGFEDTARVVTVTVGTEQADGRWVIHVDLESRSGLRGQARCVLTPDQLVMVEPGTKVSVAWDDSADCVIRFPCT